MIYDKWKNKSIENMEGEVWKPGLQLDKDIIPSKLNIPALLYSPEMCCFVTPSENNNNKIDSDFVEYKGVKMTSTQLARSVGIKPHTFHTRLHRQKWTIEQAVLPVKK